MMGDLPKMWIWRRRQFATWPVRDRRHRGRGEHRRASGGRSGRAGAHPAIAVAVIGGLAAVGLVAFIAYRVRHRRSVSGAARAARPPALVRAARPLPPPPASDRTGAGGPLAFPRRHCRGCGRHRPGQPWCQPGRPAARHMGMAPRQDGCGTRCRGGCATPAGRWCTRRPRLPDSAWWWRTPPTRQGDRSPRAPPPSGPGLREPAAAA